MGSIHSPFQDREIHPSPLPHHVVPSACHWIMINIGRVFSGVIQGDASQVSMAVSFAPHYRLRAMMDRPYQF